MGLGTQLVALALLAVVPEPWLVVPYVMVAQALSGIAKDLTKMSSKSAVKLVVPEMRSDALPWVAVLTGSKNALKGVGFFLGGLLLTVVGFQTALLILAGACRDGAPRDASADARRPRQAGHEGEVPADVLQQPGGQPARGGARLPVRLARRVVRRRPAGVPVHALGWSFWQVGTFMAVWVIGYGIVQASAPRIASSRDERATPDGATATWLAFILAAFPAGIAIALGADVDPTVVIVVGLIAFGVVFALNSAVHSYLILAYTDGDKVAMNVGFYYMANAGGRLAGTVLSGLLYQWQGSRPACGPRRVRAGRRRVSLLLPRTQPSHAVVALGVERHVDLVDGLAGSASHADQGGGREPGPAAVADEPEHGLAARTSSTATRPSRCTMPSPAR